MMRLTYASSYHVRSSRAFFLYSVAAVLAALSLLCDDRHIAHAASTPTHKEQSGSLPKSGSVVLRSGLEWMNESSQLFQDFKTEAEALLSARGLTIVEGPESSLAPMPTAAGSAGASAGKKAGKGIKLKSYAEAIGAGGGSSSPAMAKGENPQQLFFARTQQEGSPIMFRGGRIPGRVPPEVQSHDAENADYAIICRMAAVSPGYVSDAGGTSPPHPDPRSASAGIEVPAFSLGPDDLITAAGTVQGVGTLGYGSSAPASPPKSSYGGTPGDFARGYEGNSPTPGDPWHREADLRARDYQFKNSPPPVVAAPPAESGRTVAAPVAPPTPSLPKPPLPGDSDMPAVSPGPAPSRPPQSPSSTGKKSSGSSGVLFQGKKPAIAGYALEMECYDLKPVKTGKQPKVVWRCTVQQRADKPSLAAALPGMLRAALGAKGK